jgi:hypothetical protein
VTATAHPAQLRWRVLLLAALAVVLALLLPSVPASAAALPAAETRVGASGPATAVVVGVHQCITAGQRPVRGPSQPQIVVGNCVAAESGADARTLLASVGQEGKTAGVLKIDGNLTRGTRG